jgi:hypothetical protein
MITRGQAGTQHCQCMNKPTARLGVAEATGPRQ